MKPFFLLRVAIISVFAAPIITSAYLDDHGPFDPKELPKPFPVHECLLLEGTNTPSPELNAKSLTFAITNSPSVPRVKVERQSDLSQVVLSVSSADGELLLAPTKVSDLSFYIDALTADFNQDGTADYVVRIYSGGCGLACGCCDICFLLSDGEGFRTQTVHTWFPGTEDFVDLKGDGHCQFIHASYVHGEKTDKDGYVQTYWVYNLFSFDGPKLKYANDMIDGFPKWIRFTKNENHKAATGLTDDQKRRLWKRHADILGK